MKTVIIEIKSAVPLNRRKAKVQEKLVSWASGPRNSKLPTSNTHRGSVSAEHRLWISSAFDHKLPVTTCVKRKIVMYILCSLLSCFHQAPNIPPNILWNWSLHGVLFFLFQLASCGVVLIEAIEAQLRGQRQWEERLLACCSWNCSKWQEATLEATAVLCLYSPYQHRLLHISLSSVSRVLPPFLWLALFPLSCPEWQPSLTAVYPYQT